MLIIIDLIHWIKPTRSKIQVLLSSVTIGIDWSVCLKFYLISITALKLYPEYSILIILLVQYNLNYPKDIIVAITNQIFVSFCITSSQVSIVVFISHDY